MRACARVALILMALSASFALAGCAAIDELREAFLRWVESEKLPGGPGLVADDLPEAAPVIPLHNQNPLANQSLGFIISDDDVLIVVEYLVIRILDDRQRPCIRQGRGDLAKLFWERVRLIPCNISRLCGDLYIC